MSGDGVIPQKERESTHKRWIYPSSESTVVLVLPQDYNSNRIFKDSPQNLQLSPPENVNWMSKKL